MEQWSKRYQWRRLRNSVLVGFFDACPTPLATAGPCATMRGQSGGAGLSVNALLIVEIVFIGYGLCFPVIQRDLRNYVLLGIAALAAVGLMHSAWVSGGKFAELEKEFGSATRRREIARSVLFWGLYNTFRSVTLRARHCLARCSFMTSTGNPANCAGGIVVTRYAAGKMHSCFDQQHLWSAKTQSRTGRHEGVFVMQSAEDRIGTDCIGFPVAMARTGLLVVATRGRPIGNTRAERHVRAPGIVMGDPGFQNGSQMRCG